MVTGGEDAAIRKWNARSGEAIQCSLYGHTDSVTCLAMSADCKHIVSGSDDGSVRLWNEEAIGTILLDHNDAVMCVSVSEDGSIVLSGSSDNIIRLWDLKSKEIIGR